MVINNNANAENLKWKVVCHNYGKANRILNPNCSEVVWKLDVPLDTKEAILKSLEPKNDDDGDFIYTGYDNKNGLSEMIKQLDGAKNVDYAKFILGENQAGENTLIYVKECFEIAKRFKKGEITLSEAEELEQKAIPKEDDDEDDD